LVGGYDPKTTRSILWHAGASSVSVAGIQLSKAAHLFVKGAGSSDPIPHPKVFATTRQQEKCDFCVNTLGCNGAVNLSNYPDKAGWAEDIKKLNDGKGVDLVIDYLGGPFFQSNLEVLAMDGRVVQLGLLNGSATGGNIDISAFLRKRARFEGSTLRSRSEEYQIKLRDLFEEFVLPGILSGELKHIIERVVPWENIIDAHETVERNETKGKIVCTIS
jgi:NADPH:quinone reductase-like Zn-dependent oxidoreductase